MICAILALRSRQISFAAVRRSGISTVMSVNARDGVCYDNWWMKDSVWYRSGQHGQDADGQEQTQDQQNEKRPAAQDRTRSWRVRSTS